MQTIIDLDLRQVVNDFSVKSPAPPYAGKSQDTQSHEVYFVQGGAVQDLGTGPAIKYGLIGPAGPSLLVLCTSYTRQVDVNGNIFYLGFPIFNTSNLASALGTNTSIACISEVRYQLSSGEIEHTLDIPITIFRTILSEITSDTTTAAFTAPAVGANVTIAIGSTTWLQVGQQLTIATAGIYQVISITDATHFVAQNTGQPGNAISGTVIASGSAVAGAPVNALTTYPPSNTLELISTRDVASGHAGLTAAKLLNPTVIPVDGDTITIVAGQLASAAIITDTTANFTTPAANATVSVAVVSTATLVVNQFVRIPIAGYYKVTTITDATDVVLTNVGDPWNAASGVTITTGAALLPAQATAGGGSGTAGQNAYTLTSASFIVPAVGATVSVAMGTTSWLGGNGYYVFITGAGYYAVGSITDGTHAVLTNAGGTSNAPPGTTVPTNTQVAACGPPGAAGASGAGLAAYDALAASFTMPAVSGTVTITIGNTAWISVNQIIYIATAGYVQVSAISSATQALVTNLNYPGNATATTVIASGSRVSPGGLQGPQGTGGAGLNAFTTLSANFIQPAINATVTVNVGSTTWMAAGQQIFIQGGGYYNVSSISDVTHAVVTNLGGPSNPGAGSTITGSGTQNVTPAGTPGIGGNAYTTITASFTQPAVGSNVTITLASTAWMVQNQYVFINGGGTYQVVNINDATHAVLQNVGASGNVVSGTVVPSGSGVSPAGPPGPQGATGPSGGISDAPSDGNLYGRKNAAWSIVPSSGGGPFDPRNGLLIYEEFITNGSGMPPWAISAFQGNGTVNFSTQTNLYNSTTKAQGYAEVQCGTTSGASGVVLVYGQGGSAVGNGLWLGAGLMDLVSRMDLEGASLPATGQGYVLRFGLASFTTFSSFPSGNPYNSIFLEYSPDQNSGNLRIGHNTASGAISYTNCSATISSATFMWWELKIDTSGNITALLNGSSIGTATGAPIANSPIQPFWYNNRTSGTNNFDLVVDTLYVSMPYTR